MKSYTECVIENKSAKSRAKSIEKKNKLIKKLFDLTGYKASKKLSIKFLEKEIVNICGQI